MKISVALCTYNGAQYLQEQLASLAAQTRLPEKLIVCDDCSIDDTRRIIASFAAQAPFPVHLHVNDKTLGSTKNFERAITLCDGEIIALCDQDDVWHVEKLARCASLLEAKPKVGMVFTDAAVVDENLRSLDLRLWQRTFSDADQKLFKANKAFEVLSLRNVATGATMVFRSKFKELILPIPEHTPMIHDGWIALMISLVADVEFIPEQLIEYRQHERQQLGTPSEEETRTSKISIAGLRDALHKRYSFSKELRLLETIRERIAQHNHNDKWSFRKTPEHLQAQIAHYRTRAGMPVEKPARLPFVLKELLTFRYHLYSKGTRSAVRDLFLKEISPEDSSFEKE